MWCKQTKAFWPLFGRYGVLVMGTAAMLALATTHYVGLFGLRNAEEALRVKASLVGRCASLPREKQTLSRAELQALRDEIHSRITLVDALGNVLADSDIDPARIANLAAQPELVAAGRGEDRTVVRHSAALGEPMVYAARRVEATASPVAFVRVADSVAQVESSVDEVERTIWLSAAGIALGALCLLGLVLHRQPIDAVLPGPGPSATTEPRPTPLPADFVVRFTEEMRRPLTVIKTSGETLRFAPPDDAVEREQFLLQLDAAADGLHRLLADGATLAELANGVGLPEELELEAVPLAAALTGCVEEHRAAALERGVEVTVESPVDHAEPLVCADEGLLGQLLDCLVRAGLHWAAPGSRLRLAYRGDGRYICLRLHLAGTATTPDQLPRIFEPFFRGDWERTAPTDHSGLELAIARRLAHLLGGLVGAEPGQGLETALLVWLRRAGEAGEAG